MTPTTGAARSPHAVLRLGRGSGSPHLVDSCLDVIAEAFAPGPSTSVYLEDPASSGLAFWRTMAQEILDMMPPAERPLYVVAGAPGGQGAAATGALAAASAAGCAPAGAAEGEGAASVSPRAVAMCYRYQPGHDFSLAATERFLRPAALPSWNACGDLWGELMAATHAQHGDYLNIDFIGVRAGLEGAGLGRSLLKAILAEADERGMAVFLAAVGERNEAWYGRYGFRTVREYHSALPGVQGKVDLRFMVRPAGGAGGGLGVASS